MPLAKAMLVVTVCGVLEVALILLPTLGLGTVPLAVLSRLSVSPFTVVESTGVPVNATTLLPL